MDPSWSVAHSPEVYVYIAVMATLKFIFLKLKEQCFVKNNHGTSVIGDMFITHDC